MSKLNPTIDVRAGEELPVDAIDALIKTRIAGLTGTPVVRQFRSGHSNLTYQLEYPQRVLILRRPPRGTKTRSGHDMGREFRVMNALKPVFGAVPETFFHCTDDAVLGCEFYVMEKVDGRVLGRELPDDAGFDEATTRRLCESFWDRLIDLHRVDYASAGLGEFGKPEGYLERQILGWNKRYAAAHTPDVDDFAAVRRWLEVERPADTGRAAIVHGDYRLDNVVLAADRPDRIVAVLDWEISALGDPLMDLANSLAYWIEPDDPPGLRALIMQPSDAPGMMTRTEVLKRYGRATGIDLTGFDYFLVYGYFRLAVILQQIYYRHYHGQTTNPAFAGFRDSVMILGRHCETLIDRG